MRIEFPETRHTGLMLDMRHGTGNDHVEAGGRVRTSIDVKGARGRDGTWTQRRVLASGAALLYLGFVGAFFLPFVSVSCTRQETTVQSEVITGWELVNGDAPELRVTPGATRDPQVVADAEADVLEAIDEVSGAAQVSFFVGATLLAASASGVFLSVSREAFVKTLYYGGLFHVLSMIALGTAGSEMFGPVIHHHYGLALASGLSAVSPAGAMVIGLKSRVLRWTHVAASLVLFVLLGMGLVMLSGF